MPILDIHTHHPAPQPLAIIACSPLEFNPLPGQLYSVGIHPWKTTEDIPEELWEKLETAAANPQVVAIGECGIDLLKGGPLFRQMLVMKRQALLSEKLKKPLIIHSVRAQEIVIGMRKDLKPDMDWLIHGFRGKPTIAEMYLKAGFQLSLGQHFNNESLSIIPAERLFAETDEADCSIQEVIASLSDSAGQDLTATIARNSAAFIGIKDDLNVIPTESLPD